MCRSLITIRMCADRCVAYEYSFWKHMLELGTFRAFFDTELHNYRVYHADFEASVQYEATLFCHTLYRLMPDFSLTCSKLENIPLTQVCCIFN